MQTTKNNLPITILKLFPGILSILIIRIRYYKRKVFLGSCKDVEFDESFFVKHH